MESIVAQVATAAVMLTSPATSTYDSQRILVKLEPGTTPTALGPIALAAGVELERALPQINVYVLRAPAGDIENALALLRRHPLVEVAQREIVVAAVETNPNDREWTDQWGVRRAGFHQVWGTTRSAPRTIVAVVDTGVERSHPDLSGVVLRGADFVNSDGDATDDHGHGTAVAGIVAARANNGIGIAGACWSCGILPVKVLGRDGTGISSEVAAGIIWAAEHGARVINLSLGSFATTVALSDALAYAAARDVVLVGAAGNDGKTARFFPAADEHVVAVAATDSFDRLYPWSNRGQWVDVAAPGCNSSLWRKAGYAGFCGTSAASPLVAALAGLLRSVRPRASASEIVEAIRASAVSGITIGGYGRIDAARALSLGRSPGGGPMPGGLGKSRLTSSARSRRSSPRRHSGPALASPAQHMPASPLPASPAQVSGPGAAFGYG